MEVHTLDTRQLRAFAILAKTGSFTKAAQDLHLTQSAVSHAMKALEQDAGCRLLDRTGKKVTPTEAGELLLVHAERILSEMAHARAALEKLGKWGQSRLRIGASATACQHLLPPVLREFRNEFPKCRITIAPGDTPEMIEFLRAGKIDLAVNLEPPPREPLEFRALFTDEMQFIVAPTHPWALAGRASRDEIAMQNYILYTRGSYTGEAIDDYFREDEIVLRTAIEMGSISAIKEMVKLDLGVSILAPWTVAEETKAGTLVTIPLGKRKLKRRWGVLHWQARRLSIQEERFVKLAQASCKGIAQ
jgi:LysR family transcriptional regulator, low CO2-responsive transcriptional regulator